jgi:hypothetical protein
MNGEASEVRTFAKNRYLENMCVPLEYTSPLVLNQLIAFTWAYEKEAYAL